MYLHIYTYMERQICLYKYRVREETESERERDSEIEKVTWQKRARPGMWLLALDHGFVAQSQIQCRNDRFNAESQGSFFLALGRRSGVELKPSGVEHGFLALDFSVGFVFRRWAAHPMPESGVEDPRSGYVRRITYYVVRTYYMYIYAYSYIYTYIHIYSPN